MDTIFTNPQVPLNAEKIKLLKAEWAPDGFYTYWEGMPPRKGLMLTQNGMPYVDSCKNIVMVVLKLIKETPLKYLLVIPWVKNKVLEITIQNAYKVLSYIILEDDKWCKSGQEICKVWKVNRLGLDDREANELKYQLKSTFLCLWEYDESYRYRAQDIYAEIDHYELAEKPRKELKRLIDIGTSREGDESMKKKWKIVRLLITLALPGTIRKIKDIILQLDPEKMLLDDDDYEWAKHKDYKWGYKN